MQIAVRVVAMVLLCVAGASPCGAAPDRTGDAPANEVSAQERDRMSSLHLPQGVPQYTHVLRVTFAFDADKVTLEGVVRVAMRVTAPTTPTPDENTTGYWLELRDAQGKVLYHRALHDPTRLDVEVFGDKPGEPMRRVPATRSSGTFEVLVPDLPGGARVVLRGPRTGAKAQTAAAARSEELAGYDMAELHRHAANAARGKPPAGGSSP
jgi:hypothetical protein